MYPTANNAGIVGLRAAESVLNALRIELFKGISEFGSVSSKSKSEVKRIFERYGKVNVDDNERCEVGNFLALYHY
jgi:hypothetical protein